MVSLFIFPIGTIALNSEPRGRRYVKNMGHDRNHLYSMAIHYLEFGWTKPWCPGLVSRPSAKAKEPVARSRGLVIYPPKLLVGAYFELLFIGCGFLIHLSNRSDNPRFRAPWKKICKKYGTQQEPSLFKGHPLSC